MLELRELEAACDAAKKDVEMWKEKKRVVEEAEKAIQALKDLMD